ncbi:MULTISPECIES: iron chelate uptake ABC transporter family permease subunit [Thiomicrorhabdus]|uniref:Metal ABC transporter permease n=1 Tax=Thiomicrorhabdus heinhorstiae TaxID=2748010 RepID=A0ABS0BU00_9GAMM|nr:MULTISPECIES: iron chelate uptake ABC transporter family permease subunit [Thiomicrorhabdus]MBF6057318.1 metal ABC transporter permease [Thiomicrorhabdus heinhorstiae]
MEAWNLTHSVSMWDNLAAFWRFEDINALWVLSGSILLGMSASVIGAFAFLRKRSLIGDALAHAALPGVMMAFLLFQSRDPVVIFFGALLSSFVGFFIIDWLPKNTKIKPDAALAITLSFFFALGLMLLSYIQGAELENKSGLDKILFGQAAAMTESDIHLLAYVSLFILITVALFFQKFRLIAFNRIYAQSLGISVKSYELLLALLIVMSVVVGLQLVGVVLMAAVLLTPIAATRYWSNQLTPMLLLASTIGALSALISTQVSYLAPAMPTGPWMVVSLSLLFMISLFFGTNKGLLKRWLETRALRKRVAEENILRTFYKLSERQQERESFSMADVQGMRNMQASQLHATLDQMLRKGLILSQSGGYRLSESGMQQASQLTRRHRLWENYLMQQAELSPDMVHQQAERMEHILTADEETKLQAELNSSHADPHGQPIPQGKGERHD